MGVQTCWQPGEEHVSTDLLPEVGQLVQVRGRYYIAQDVIRGGRSPYQHRIELECIDDDAYGERLAVLWEREVVKSVHDAVGWPRPDAHKWDRPERLKSFLHATRWSAASVLTRLPLQAPFRGAIEITEYQLEPVVRALQMPRVNLLIADDVGLGKTIEAGLVMQELLARQRARRIMVVCPASLQRQWQEEMRERFALEFAIVDRDYAHNLRREYGIHVNPWNSYPRIITSMDYLKREVHLHAFKSSLQAKGQKMRDWDLLIVDEAHNLAPSGSKHYVRDSERTRMLRQVLEVFEHRLFLTATPHNGRTESFTALLEMLDPLRFSRGNTVNTDQLRKILVRRMKDDITDSEGNRVFPERVTEPPIQVPSRPGEREVYEGLDQYIEARMSGLGGGEMFTVGFALTLLKKRLLSSPYAFFKSLTVHLDNLTRPRRKCSEEEPTPDLEAVKEARRRTEEDYSDDFEKSENEAIAVAESSRFIELDPNEEGKLLDLYSAAEDLAEQTDSKTEALLGWIDEHLRDNGEWTDERLIVFTEYKDTLDYLVRVFEEHDFGDRVLTFYGGISTGERAAIKEAFLAHPREHPVRILLATDAAAEGLNLQEHCRYLIHYEIPWNPVKMEQRNGRIDRHGQPADKVYCLHFVHEDSADSRFLDQAVEKVEQMRTDLGSVGDVIASSIETSMLGRHVELGEFKSTREKVREELRADVLTQERIEQLREELKTAREVWSLTPENLYDVLEQALEMTGHPGLEHAGEGLYRLPHLPASWHELKSSITDRKGRILKLAFDSKIAFANEHTRLIHLEHPLMRRAASAFRANLWSSGLHQSHDLQRVTYRVIDGGGGAAPALLGFARLVVIGRDGAKLHEEIVELGGEIAKANLESLDLERIKALLDAPYKHPKLPLALATQLTMYFPSHVRTLERLLETARSELEVDVRNALADKANAEAKLVRELIKERIKEIDQRVKDAERDYGDQVPLFSDEEMGQYNEDLNWLKRRREALREGREDEVKKVKTRYEVRDVRMFPLALTYVIPKPIVEAGGLA